MTETKTFSYRNGETLPLNMPDGTRAFNLDTHEEYVFISPKWYIQGVNEGIQSVKNEDGTHTIKVQNLEVAGSFAANEVYYQNMNGMNGALLIAPSGRVKKYGLATGKLPPAGVMLDVRYATDTKALLSGNVEPNEDKNVMYWFEYGRTSYWPEAGKIIPRTGFEFSTPKRAANTNKVIQVGEAVASLMPSSQYSVRLVVSSGKNLYYSNTVRFTTLKGIASLIALTNDATQLTGISATLNGYVTTAGKSLSYYFKVWTLGGDYQLETAHAAVPNLAGVPVTFAIAGLKPGIAYYYCLMLIDGDKHIAGRQIQFSTLPVIMIGQPMYEEPPTVSAARISNIETEAATFSADITSAPGVRYRFEWWTSPANVQQSILITKTTNGKETVTFTTPNLKTQRTYQVQLTVYWDDDYNQMQTAIYGGTTEFTTLDM